MITGRIAGFAGPSGCSLLALEAACQAEIERTALWSDLEHAVALQERADGSEQRLLAWLDFWSQGNHDDRTIAILY